MSERVLEDTLRQILDVVKPVNSDWLIRFQIIEDLQAIVPTVELLRGATAEPFGSFVSNLFTRSGDLDISVELANGSFISFAGKKEKQKLLRALMRAMRRRDGWDKFNYIPHARVPILKVESTIQNISCDISIDNLQAQMKSKFLLWISEIDTRFRDMVLLVKEWAKAHNINSPKTGTFNSFSLSLLVVFHFQTCDPLIFPPLRDIYPGNIAEDLKGLRANAERQIAETCASNIFKFKSSRNRRVNKSSLSELFILFLSKFYNINTMAKDWGICPFTGQWEYIKGITRWLPQTYAIFVEDPFEQPENCARAVNSRQLERISEAFKSSYNKLLSGNNDQNTLLVTLSQRQTYQQLMKLVPGAYHQPNLHPRWQSQVASRATYSHSQAPTRSQSLAQTVHSQSLSNGSTPTRPRAQSNDGRPQLQSQSRTQTVHSQGLSNGSTSTRPRAQSNHGQPGPQFQSQTMHSQRPPNGSTSTRPRAQSNNGQPRLQSQTQTPTVHSQNLSNGSTSTRPRAQSNLGQHRPQQLWKPRPSG